MKKLANHPITLAVAGFAVAAALIVLIPLHPELRWAAVVIFAVVSLGLIALVRRGLRQQAAAAAYAIAQIRVSDDLASQDGLRANKSVDGQGPLFEPVLMATRAAADAIQRQHARSEENRHQLEALLQGMPDAVLGVDAAGRVQWSNAPMAKLMERGHNASSIRHGRALVHTFRDPAFLATVQRTLNDHAVAECRTEGLLPGRIFDVNSAPLPGGGAVVVLHDSTRAEQMERTQRDFVANVSHELRTPLTSIVGYVETVLDNEELSVPAREFLETVLKNGSRMHRLTEDLLLLSRIEQNENPLEPEPVAAEALVQDALRTVSGTPYAEGATLEVTAVTNRTVIADENAVLQVLGNLLENAVKYSSGRSEAPRVLISAQDFGPDPAFVLFRVQDFGPGIASEHLTRIFERFYRVEKARSRATGGTGLGLSIARHLIEQMGGQIWAESELGRGSTFLFTLPAVD